MTEETAERCRCAMEAEDAATFGTELQDRVFKLPASDVAEWLAGDRATDTVFGPAPVDYARMTLTEYFDRVFWPVRSNPATEIGVKAHTAENELLYWRHTGKDPKGNPREKRGILDGALGTVRLGDLDDVMWHRWMTEQTHLSARSKALRRNAYAQLLTYARLQGHSKFRPEFARLKGAGQTTREKVDPLDIDEIGRLLGAADPVRRAMWGLGIGVGLRPGELVRVEWQDIDWDEQTMLVRGTKTEESWDRIPMSPLAYREMRAFWLLEGQPIGGPCFTYGGRGVEREPSKARRFVDYKKALASDARKAGIKRKVTKYLLRHSFATLAWALDIEKDVARRIMRHTDESMLDRVYMRPRPRDMVARLANLDIATG